MNKCIEHIQNTCMYPLCLHSWWGRVMAGKRGANSSSQPEKQTGRGPQRAQSPGTIRNILSTGQPGSTADTAQGSASLHRQITASEPHQGGRLPEGQGWTGNGCFLIPRNHNSSVVEKDIKVTWSTHVDNTYTVSFESPVFKNNLVSTKYKLHKCTLNCPNW